MYILELEVHFTHSFQVEHEVEDVIAVSMNNLAKL